MTIDHRALAFRGWRQDSALRRRALTHFGFVRALQIAPGVFVIGLAPDYTLEIDMPSLTLVIDTTEEMFSIKRGSTLKPLRLGIYDAAGVLIPFGSLTNPQLILRRPGQLRSEALVLPLTEYTDPAMPPTLNVEHVWVTGETDIAGVYNLEVEATIGADVGVWPDPGRPQMIIEEDVGDRP